MLDAAAINNTADQAFLHGLSDDQDLGGFFDFLKKDKKTQEEKDYEKFWAGQAEAAGKVARQVQEDSGKKPAGQAIAQGASTLLQSFAQGFAPQPAPAAVVVPATPPPTPWGKYAMIVGGIAVLGVGGFLAYRSMRD